MTLDSTAISAILKDQWPEGLDTDLVYQNRPLLAMIKREKDFTGEYYNIPIQYALGSARSNTFATAQGLTKDNAYAQFQVTSATDYGFGKIDGKVVRKATKGAAGAGMFVDALKAAVESAIEQMAQTCSQRAYRSQTGAICQCHATTAPTGTTLTLDTPSSASYFQVGDEIVLSETDGGSLRDSGDSVTVTGIDRDSGTLTIDNISAISGAAAADYIYIKGSAQNGGTAVAAAGLGSWCPVSAPSATTFFGVNRTLEVAKLGGRRVSSTGESIETIFTKADAVCNEAGFDPDVIFIHPQDAARLQNAKEGSKLISDKFSLGFRTLEANGRRFVMDKDCPEGYAFMLDLKGGSFRWLTNGDIEVDEADGAPLSRIATEDAYEMRLALDHQFGGFNPGKIVRVAVPTA